MRRFKVFSLVLLILVYLCGCGGAEPSSSAPIADEAVHLRSVLEAYSIDFTDDNTELHLYRADRGYFLKNKYKNAVQAITYLIGNSRGVPCAAYEYEENDLCFYVCSTDWECLTIRVNSKNQIHLSKTVKEAEVYHSNGIYETLLAYVQPLLKETETYYSVTADMFENKYIIYDKNGNPLASDTTSDTPHIFISDDGIIHHWQQAGTGTLTRWAVFYDWESGRKSPVHYGNTDHAGSLVSSAGHSVVEIRDMFSGELLHTIDTFDQPLGDCMENITSAYFCNDSRQLKVNYLTETFDTAEQVFDLPEELLKR